MNKIEESMSIVVDLCGQVFGYLTVIERVGSDKQRHTLWLCECTCGNKTTAITTWLLKS